MIQRIINSETHRSLGVSPSQIIFCNAINLNRYIIHPIRDEPLIDGKLSHYMANMLLKQQAIIDIAKKNQYYRDELVKHTGDNLIPTEFKISSYVLVEYPEGHPPTKFHPIKRCPLKVVSYLGRQYKLLNLVTNNLCG